MEHQNNLDKKLRDLENQSIPDLTQMDQHWREFQKTIHPAKVDRPIKRMVKWVAAAVFVTGMVVIVTKIAQKNSRNKQIDNATIISGNAAQKTDTTRKPIIVRVRTSDGKDTSLEAYTVESQTVQPKLKLQAQPKYDHHANVKSIIVGKDSNGKNIIGTVIGSHATNKNDTLQLLINADSIRKDNRLLLQHFFKQLEKESQEFVIQPRRDTVIYGIAGTSLLIPAQSFKGTSPVTIELKEFYNYADMVTNKLSTMSGNRQLETGGMIHLRALQDGKEVNIAYGKSIRWFLPDSSMAEKQMQLFTGEKVSSANQLFFNAVDKKYDKAGKDTIQWTTVSEGGDAINWVAQENWFSDFKVNTRVMVINFRNTPYQIKYFFGRTVAYFYFGGDAVYSRQALKDTMMKRDVRYDRVALRKKNTKWYRKNPFEADNKLGDTIVVSPDVARIYKLKVIDTIFRSDQFSGQKNVSSAMKLALMQADKKYSIQLDRLGWINCDRFYRESGSRVNFIADLEDGKASDYVSFLVFDRFKSVMSGEAYSSRVKFGNIPEGEKAKLVIVGIRDGKPVASITPIVTKNNTLKGLAFTETDPDSFRNAAVELDQE